jgi:predicted dehydrogenase
MIRIGIIGTGGMAKYHAQEFSKTPGVKVVACCDVVEERVKEFAKEYKIPATYTDYHKMLREEKLDGVTNVTPDPYHAEISLAVIAKGLAILCEKPLATSLADARKMDRAARKRGVVNMVNFSYRNSCGLQAAAKAIAAGAIGRVMHVEASYLQSWLAHKGWGDYRTKPALTWRLSTKHGSAGVLGDLGCHIYDLTTLLAGDIEQINCKLKTFDKGHPGNRIGPYVLDANDSFVSTVVFKNGAIGTIHSSRWASGHHNSLRARVYGDKGAIEVDLDSAYDSYKICKGAKAQETAKWDIIKCKRTPNNVQRFIQAMRTGKKDPCDFTNGTKIQAYLHYSMVSDKTGRTAKVEI